MCDESLQLFWIQKTVLGVSQSLKPQGRSPMKGIKIILLITAGCLMAGPLHADIYEWTDENGVKHFTNYAPPDDAKILMKTKELPYDEAADRARMEDERQFLEELAKLERAAKDAELERRVAEAERRAAEAERYAEETWQATEKYLNDASNSRWYYRVGPYYPYYPAPYRHYYKRKYHKIKHYRHGKKAYDPKYHRKKYARPHKYKSSHRLRTDARSTHGSYHVKARSKGRLGGIHTRRGGYGFRR